MKIGFVGVGVIGAPMVAALLDAGHELSVYDLRSAAVEGFGARGATIAASPRAAAQGCEMVITSLPGPTEVRAAVLDDEIGVLAGIEPGAIYIDTTTNSRACTREVAERCAVVGVDFLDGPVTAGPLAKTMFLGGDGSVVARARPVLAAICDEAVHLGPVGSGCVAKLVSQLVAYGNFVTAADGLTLAAKAGIDVTVLTATLQKGWPNSAVLGLFYERVFTRDFEDKKGAPLDLLAKDMRLVAELARDLDVDSPAAARLHDLFSEAQNRGWGRQSFSSIVRLIEEGAGTELIAGGPKLREGASP